MSFFLNQASIYSGMAVAIAFWLLWHNTNQLTLLLIYLTAIAALIFDLISVWHRQPSIIFHLISSAIFLFSIVVRNEKLSDKSLIKVKGSCIYSAVRFN